MSKGSKQRPTDAQKYSANWEKIFGMKNKKEEKTSHKDEPLKKDK
jgi:hypothetical protein